MIYFPKTYGTCNGANKAISLAYKLKNDNKDKNIYIFKELLHNPYVINELKENGIFCIDDLSILKDDDIVIILGDISWNCDLSKLDKLKGRKILVRGNHDKKSCESYMQYFDFACESFKLDYKGVDIVFTHEPLLKVGADLNIHGHLHNRPNYEKKKH